MVDEDSNSEIRKARQGDRACLSRLLNRHQKRLELLANQRLGPELKGRLRASDVLQSAWLDVLRSFDRFEGETEEDFGNWAARILENNIRDKAKYFGARKRAGVVRPLVEHLEDRGLTEGSKTPSMQASSVEEYALFDQALGRLPPRSRRVIELRYIDGLDSPRIAHILETTPRAVRSLLVRARAALALEFNRLRKQPSGD